MVRAATLCNIDHLFCIARASCRLRQPSSHARVQPHILAHTMRNRIYLRTTAGRECGSHGEGDNSGEEEDLEAFFRRSDEILGHVTKGITSNNDGRGHEGEARDK